MRKIHLYLLAIYVIVLFWVIGTTVYKGSTVLAAENTQLTAPGETPNTENLVPDIGSQIQGLKEQVIQLQTDIDHIVVLSVLQSLVILGMVFTSYLDRRINKQNNKE